MKLRITSLILLTMAVSIAQAQLTLMSYNIRYANPGDGENWWENRKQDVTALINRYHPDFLGIQEGLDHQVHYLDQTLRDYQYVGKGREGLGVVSEFTAIYYDSAKFKLLATKTFWLSTTPEKVSKGWDAALNRISTYAAFEERSTGNNIHVFNAHFDHMGTEARKNSAQLMVEQISDWNLLDEQLVVMGDFNSTPDSDPIGILNEMLTDSRTALSLRATGPEGTFSGFEKGADLQNRIDYIFIKNLEVLNQRHIDDLRPNNLWPSDHLPVYAVLKTLE